MKARFAPWAALALALVASPALAQSAVSRHVTGAGAVGVTAGAHSIRSTAGQPVTGAASASGIALRSGFWAPFAILLDAPVEPVPLAWALHAPRPNPARGGFTIGFDAPRSTSPARLELFDLHGRRLRLHEVPPGPGGRHTVRWNAREGSRLVAGIYLCTLDAPGHRSSRKLILLP
jgi:hypothetical protein